MLLFWNVNSYSLNPVIIWEIAWGKVMKGLYLQGKKDNDEKDINSGKRWKPRFPKNEERTSPVYSKRTYRPAGNDQCNLDWFIQNVPFVMLWQRYWLDRRHSSYEIVFLPSTLYGLLYGKTNLFEDTKVLVVQFHIPLGTFSGSCNHSGKLFYYFYPLLPDEG